MIESNRSNRFELLIACHASPNRSMTCKFMRCDLLVQRREVGIARGTVGPQDQTQRDLPRFSVHSTAYTVWGAKKQIKAAANPTLRRHVSPKTLLIEQPLTRPHHVFPRNLDSCSAVAPPRAGCYFRVASGDRTNPYRTNYPLLLVLAQTNCCRHRRRCRSGKGTWLCSPRWLPTGVRWPFRLSYFKTHRYESRYVGSRTQNKKRPPHRTQFNLRSFWKIIIQRRFQSVRFVNNGSVRR